MEEMLYKKQYQDINVLIIIITKWGTKKKVVWNKSQRPEIIGREARNNKYLGVNSNIMVGSFTSRSEPFLHGVSKVQKLISASLNPMDSFLLARGLRTLDVRMQMNRENVMYVAHMLEESPIVAEV